MPTGGVDIGVGSLLASGLGATAGGIAADALVGAGGGALLGGAEGALTGGNIGKDVLHGAEGGALTGGGIGLGGDLLGSTLGTTAADALGGAAGGALGGVATGSSPLTGAIGGAASGGLAGALSGPSNAGTYGATGGPSGVPAPAPSSVVPSTGDVSLDMSSLDPSQFSTLNGGGMSQSLISSANAANNVIGATDASNPNLNTLGTSNTSSVNVGNGTTGTQPLANNAANLGATTPDVSQWGQGLNGATGNANSGSPDPYGLSAAGGQTPASLQSAAAAASGAGGATGGGAQTNPLTTALKDVWANPTAGNFGNLLTASPSADIAAAGLGVDALKENQMAKGQRQLQQEAGAEAAQGASLESYLSSGTLPPRLQAGVDQASQSAIASIKSQYAARGMSGSSAEAQDIAAAQQRAQAQGAQMAMQLLNTGISETGMSSELYKAIMGNALQQDANLGSAISGFAQAAAGGVPQKQTQPATGA